MKEKTHTYANILITKAHTKSVTNGTIVIFSLLRQSKSLYCTFMDAEKALEFKELEFCF